MACRRRPKDTCPQRCTGARPDVAMQAFSPWQPGRFRPGSARPTASASRAASSFKSRQAGACRGRAPGSPPPADAAGARGPQPVAPGLPAWKAVHGLVELGQGHALGTSRPLPHRGSVGAPRRSGTAPRRAVRPAGEQQLFDCALPGGAGAPQRGRAGVRALEHQIEPPRPRARTVERRTECPGGSVRRSAQRLIRVPAGTCRK